MSLFKPRTKQEKQLITVILIVLGLVVAWLAWKYYVGRRAAKQVVPPAMDQEPVSSSNPTNTVSTPTGCTNSTILQLGTKCNRVQWVQYKYNQSYAIPKGKTKLVEDGVFGEKTKAAVVLITGKSKISWDEFLSIINSKYPSQNAIGEDDYWDMIGNILSPINPIGLF